MRFYTYSPAFWETFWRTALSAVVLCFLGGSISSCSKEFVCPQGTAGTPCTPNGDLGSQPEIPSSGDADFSTEPDANQTESKDQNNESDTGTDTIFDVPPFSDILDDTDGDSTSETSIEDALEKSAEEPKD